MFHNKKLLLNLTFSPQNFLSPSYHRKMTIASHTGNETSRGFSLRTAQDKPDISTEKCGLLYGFFILQVKNQKEVCISMKNTSDKFSHVSLFSGAGGLDIGLEQAGFTTIWANDSAHDACETHKSWSNATVVEGDIEKVDFDTIPDCDLASFGFPCQGFSLSGPRRIDDSRNTLYRHCVKLVEKKQPKLFLAENVKGLLSLGGGQIKDAIISDFENRGYVVTLNLVNAADYHVPEDRQRVIIVGIRKDLVEKYGVSFVMPEPYEDRITLREALKGIAPPTPDEICDAPYSSRYMSRNRKRGWDEVAFTVPAMAKQVALWPGSPDMEKIDADHWKFGVDGISRRLSYKEVAAIQTFPKGMVFCGNLTSKYKQIGNAVPCELARVVGTELHYILEKCR